MKRFLACTRLPVLLIPLVLLVACNGAPEAPEEEEAGGPTLEDPQARGSYAIGVDLANRLESQGLPVSTDELLAGIRDGLEGTPQLEQEELQAAMQEFQGFMAEARAGEAEENRVAGETFLADNLERSDIDATDTGLQYEVIEEGDGPRPDADDTVRVHYRGTTINGEVFDESYSRGEPAEFPLDAVIPGWTEALQLMPVGSKWKIYLPAELGYGDNAPPGAPFGPGETLVFEIELLEIVEE